MGDLVLKGATSGQITVTPTAVAGTNTLTVPATTGTLMVTSSTGDISISGTLAMGSSFLRNRIINGDMRIDQRNAGASVTIGATTSTYTIDRWTVQSFSGSKFSVQQNAGSVTPPAGFSNYLGITSLAATSPGSTDYYGLFHQIEGYNVADLAFGSASAKTTTLSFWVRSSLTGSFSGSYRNNAANRSYPFSYTISSANTWEYKTVTIAGDTTGTWTTDNSIGLGITFNIGAGSSYLSTAGTWQAGNYYGVTGSVSVIGTNGATFYITGVQLEVGSVATPFERRQYGQELALCQRYYQQYSGNQKMIGHGYMASATVMYRWGFPLGIEMRTAPTLAFSGDVRVWGGSGPNTASATSTVGGSFTQTNFVDADINCAGVTTTAGLVGKLILNTSTAAVTLSAEL